MIQKFEEFINEAQDFEKFAAGLNKRKPSHDNFRKISQKLKDNGFIQTETFYDSKNSTTSGAVNDGGIWEKDGVKIQTDFWIAYESYEPRSLSVKLIK